MSNNQQTFSMVNHPTNVPHSRKKPSRFAWRGILSFSLIVLVAFGTLMLSGCSPKMTKVEWLQKADKAFPDTVFARTLANCESKKFKKLMGEPNSTQTVGNDANWYYDCSDGKIQIVMNAANLDAGYMAGQINDY